MKEKGQMIKNMFVGTTISSIMGMGFNQYYVHFVLDQQGSNSIANSCLRVGVFAIAGLVFGATLSLKEPDPLQKDDCHEYEDNLVQNKHCFFEHQESNAETKLVQKPEKQKEKKKVRGRLRMNRNQQFLESMQYINAHPEIFCSKS